jgi:putative redox protein
MGKHRPISATWEHRGMVFKGGGETGVTSMVDGDAKEAPSPVDTLLIALAGCTGSDVVLVAGKKRIDLKALRVEVLGERRESEPRRFVKLHLVYHVTAPGATEQAVRHAIDLSLEKYCSVTHSLNPDIPVTYELRLES